MKLENKILKLSVIGALFFALFLSLIHILNENLYILGEEKLKDIEVLPESLQEALDIAKESEFIKSVIGSEFLNRYVELKQTEVDRYNKAIEKENIKRMYFEYI